MSPDIWQSEHEAGRRYPPEESADYAALLFALLGSSHELLQHIDPVAPTGAGGEVNSAFLPFNGTITNRFE